MTQPVHQSDGLGYLVIPLYPIVKDSLLLRDV